MYCFDKSRRLLKKHEYDDVFQQPKKLITPGFILLYRPNTLGYARLGLAISKKALAKAHDRNQVKRLLRETFRVRKLPAVDIVVLAKQGLATLKNGVTAETLGAVWDKLSITNPMVD